MRLIFIALVVSAAFLYYSNAAHSMTSENLSPNPEPEPQPEPQTDSVLGSIENMVAKFTVPAKYASIISQAETDNGLPSGLLARVLYRESRFREDIISGKVRSSVGALGIAQFMPSTAVSMGVDPLDPFSAIPGAARYLAQLFRTTGSWPEAVAAYNWGVGNVQRKGIEKAPKETRDYLAEVMTGLGLA